MTQPSFVPIAEADQVRPSRRLTIPRRWTTDRPAELTVPMRHEGRARGTPGPDQGFALRIARRFEERLRLEAGERADDVVVGAALLAARRAALFGRAPCAKDLEAVLTLWGFLLDAPPAELVAERRRAFLSAGHDYVVQRALADRVPEEALRLGQVDLSARLEAGEWRRLVGSGPA